MIYKNEDGSIYKITKVTRKIVIGDVDASNYEEIKANSNSIRQIIKVLNYFLKKENKKDNAKK